MKFVWVVFILLTCISCFPFDPIPQVHIVIDKSLIKDIDSISLFDTTKGLNLNSSFSKKVNEPESEYFIHLNNFNPRIRIKLKNNEEIVSDTLRVKDFKATLKITKVNNLIKFNYTDRTKFAKYAPMILIILLVIFFTKILLALFILWPSSKMTFLKIFGGLNALYFIIFMLLFIFLPDIAGYFLYPFYLIIILLDVRILKIKYNNEGRHKAILAGILGNVAFITLGQLIITFALMRFS